MKDPPLGFVQDVAGPPFTDGPPRGGLPGAVPDLGQVGLADPAVEDHRRPGIRLDDDGCRFRAGKGTRERDRAVDAGA